MPGPARATWLPLVAAIVVALVCVRLGFWQLDRLEGRRAFNAHVRAGLAEPPVPIEQALEEAAGDVDRLAYRRAEATGRYDSEHEVILYGRTLAGRPGNHVLTPLVLEGDRALLVDRGWVPFEDDAPPLQAPLSAPTDDVTVSGVLRPPDTASETTDASSPADTVKEVDLAALDEHMPFRLLPVYLQLSEQDPPQVEGLPAPAPLPELSEGPHLGYALQWFAFATIALVGYVVLLRRGRRPVADGDSPEHEAPASFEGGARWDA